MRSLYEGIKVKSHFIMNLVNQLQWKEQSAYPQSTGAMGPTSRDISIKGLLLTYFYEKPHKAITI